MLTGASAPDGEWVGEPGDDEAFFLEPGECGVDGANGDVVSRAAFDFLADGDAVGVVAEVEEGEHDEELELAEAVFTHGSRLRMWERGTGNREPSTIFEKVEEIDTGRWWRVCFGLRWVASTAPGNPISVGGGMG